jgi:uncharacterized protein (TIGR02452 family)
MIYSPQIHIFRDDLGKWTKPFMVDMITSAAEVRAHARMCKSTMREIEETMRERMARILYLFEWKGMNSAALVQMRLTTRSPSSGRAAVRPRCPIQVQYSFDRVLFAIADKRTLNAFKDAFIKMQPKKPKAAPPFQLLLEMLR